MATKTENENGSWLPKAILVLGLIIVALISFAIFKETYRKKQIQKEISSLQAEVERVQKDNASLSDKIAYLGSNDYQEKEAKDKLNLQKPDEQVVIINPGQAQKQEVQGDESVHQEIVVKVSNPEKWWDYFFKY